MEIKVNYERVVKNNEALIKITDLHALTESELPGRYLDGFPKAYLTEPLNEETRYITLVDEHKIHHYLFHYHLQEGRLYTRDEFEEYVKLLKKCARRLAKINEKLRKESRNWKKEQLELTI